MSGFEFNNKVKPGLTLSLLRTAAPPLHHQTRKDLALLSNSLSELPLSIFPGPVIEKTALGDEIV